MQRFTPFLLVLLTSAAILPAAAFAQSSSAAERATCNFDDDKQLVVEYQPVTVNLKKSLAGQVPMGKVWAPGGKPMTLFTNTPVEIGSRVLPVGAYTMFVLPNAKQWTLVVSKSTDMSGAYDEKSDLARVNMDSGELPNPEPTLNISFAHVGPAQCNIRVDLDKYGHFTGFQVK
jgi:Protein of unknown function (DUF2911)